MPRVRLLVRMNVADGHHEAGDVVDVDKDVAANLSRFDRAVIVRGEQPETPERKRHPVETAAKKTSRPS